MAVVRKSLYERWLTELWNGDVGRLEVVAAELVTPDFVGHWPGRPNLVRGPGALAEIVRVGRRPFDPLTFTVDVGPLSEGDLVAARWVGRGRYAGGDNALPGATAPRGTPIEFHGHDLLRLENGRFAEYWVISTETDLMAQLTAPPG